MAAVAVLAAVGVLAVLPTAGRKAEKLSSSAAGPTPVRVANDQAQTVRGEGDPISAAPLVQITAEDVPIPPEDVPLDRNAKMNAKAARPGFVISLEEEAAALASSGRR